VLLLCLSKLCCRKIQSSFFIISMNLFIHNNLWDNKQFPP
jgi:hypothetical protein